MTDIDYQKTHDLTTEQLDALAFSRIGKKWIDFERLLYKSKWFDYRFLHPVKATMIYMDEFGTAYRRFYAQTYDTDTSKLITVPKGDNFLENDEKFSSRILGCWRGRQVADALGMPYDIYINLAMTNRLQYWRQKQLPRPQQLYSEIIVEKLPELWKKRQEIKLFYSSHQNYRCHRYQNYSWQNDHHNWLFDQAFLRSNASVTLARFIDEDLISSEMVKARVGSETFEKVMSHTNQ